MNNQEENPAKRSINVKEIGIVLFVLLAFLTPLLLLSFPVMINGEFSATRKKQKIGMKQAEMLTLLRKYINEHQKFPQDITDKDGNPICSWRAHFPRQGKGDVNFILYPDEHWKSEKYDQYRTGSYNNFSYNLSWKTNVVTINDEGTYYQVGGIPEKPVLMLIEVSNFDKHWMEPGDITIDELKNIIEGNSYVSLGIGDPYYRVIFSNSATVNLKTETPFEELRPFLTVEEAKKADFEAFQKKYRY